MKLYTLPEAEALLPAIREELAAMQACKREVDAIRGDLEHAAGKSSGNGHVKDENALAKRRQQAEALVEEMNRRLQRFNEWGIELKGLEEGLVDFPSDRDGRTVYLCWKQGEDRIEWWHDLDAGFAGRQPL